MKEEGEWIVECTGFVAREGILTYQSLNNHEDIYIFLAHAHGYYSLSAQLHRPPGVY